jgi:hypothetical protein
MNFEARLVAALVDPVPDALLVVCAAFAVGVDAVEFVFDDWP